MAKAKKTKIEKVEIPTEQIVPEFGLASINQEKYDECEWCFQFDDNEPHVFAWTDEDMGDDEPQVQFTISNNANSNITFTHNDGKVFKIFAREMTERGREMQQKQKLFTHESKNEETAS